MVSQFGAWPVPKTLPKEVRLAFLFLNGPLAAVALAALLAFPLCNLFEEAFWVPPVLAFLMVLVFEFSDVIDPTPRALSRGLMLTEILSLGLLVPLALLALRKHAG